MAERGVIYWAPKGGYQATHITLMKDQYPFNKIFANMIAYDYNTSLAV